MLLPIDNFISLYDKIYLKLQKNNQEKITISPKSFGKSEEKNDLVIFTKITLRITKLLYQ